MVKVKWQEGMRFIGRESAHAVAMDAKRPAGGGTAMTPKELVVSGLCGCTAMDVVGLLRKHRQTVEEFEVSAEVQNSGTGHPVVFSSIALLYKISGPIDVQVLKDAVLQSQTKYCGVSAMLSKAVAITYKIELNGEVIDTGKAEFSANTSL